MPRQQHHYWVYRLVQKIFGCHDGVPQGLVLGPVLIIFFDNYIMMSCTIHFHDIM